MRSKIILYDDSFYRFTREIKKPFHTYTLFDKNAKKTLEIKGWDMTDPRYPANIQYSSITVKIDPGYPPFFPSASQRDKVYQASFRIPNDSAFLASFPIFRGIISILPKSWEKEKKFALSSNRHLPWDHCHLNILNRLNKVYFQIVHAINGSTIESYSACFVNPIEKRFPCSYDYLREIMLSLESKKKKLSLSSSHKYQARETKTIR